MFSTTNPVTWMKNLRSIARGGLALLILAGPLAAEITEPELGAFQRPANAVETNFVADEAEGELAKVSHTATFAKWKTFEDDRVKFSYPDEAGITVEVKTNEPVPVGGDRVSSVDTSYTRAYQLSVEGKTLTALMLQDADWLDDGICLCGAIVYERYLIRGGNLYRYSFLEGGVLKKMQVLGARERLMMFEWTHSPIHPEVYRKIARSVELKSSGRWQEDDCRKRVSELYGRADALGWLDEGTSAEAVEVILGKPARTDRDGTRVWEYPKEERGYRQMEKISLPFGAGKLARFDASYRDDGWEDRQVIRGSVAWMSVAANEYKDPPVRGETIKPMPGELKKELLDLFLQKAGQAGEDFNTLCSVMTILVEQGVQDEKALGIIRRRFMDEGGHYAAWVLHKAGHPEDIELFAGKIREVYRIGRANPQEPSESDLHNWLAFIPDEDARYPDLLREGLGNPNESVRTTAYFFIDSAPLPAGETHALIRAGLKDPAARVRYWAGRYFGQKPMSDEDWQLLAKAAAVETDEENLRQFQKLLETRKPRAEKEDDGGLPAGGK